MYLDLDRRESTVFNRAPRALTVFRRGDLGDRGGQGLRDERRGNGAAARASGSGTGTRAVIVELGTDSAAEVKGHPCWSVFCRSSRSTGCCLRHADAFAGTVTVPPFAPQR